VHRDFDVLRKIVTALISIALPSTGCLLGLGHQVTEITVNLSVVFSVVLVSGLWKLLNSPACWFNIHGCLTSYSDTTKCPKNKIFVV